MSLTRRTLLLGILAVAAAACASGPKLWPPYDLVPAGPEAPPKAVIERDGLRVEVEPLASEARGAWLARRTGSTRDPLAKQGLGERLLTFRMRLDALGEGPVHFQPQNADLYRGAGKPPVMPLDYTRVFELLGARRGEPTSAPSEEMRRFMRGLWDSAVTVPPGESMEGLLIFPAPREFEPPLVLRLMLVRESTQVERVRIPLVPELRSREDVPPV
jgi:hypothetical protein